MVFVIALAVRLWGLDWQLPWQLHPDEGHYTWKAMDLITTDSLNPKYFRNPSLFTYILYAQYRLLGYQAPKGDEAAAGQAGLLRPPDGVAFVGRLNSALLGTATVVAVAGIGWRFVGPWTGVIAATFLGLAFIHVRDSHYATNDVPATFLLVLSVGASLELLRRPRALAYLLAGLFGGLATSAKYNAGLFFVPLLTAHLLSPGPSAIWERGRARALHLVAALAVAVVAFVAGTPYALLTFGEFWRGFRTQMRLGGEGWEGQVPGPSGPLYVQALGEGVGWLMLALAIVGLVALARRSPRSAAVLAAFPVAYLAFMLRTELFFVRFALPVVPMVCLFAAAGLITIAAAVADRLAAGFDRTDSGPAVPGDARVRRRSAAYRFATAGLVLVALAQPAWSVFLHNRLIGREDTRVLAARWAIEHIAPIEKVQIEEYTIRDRRPRAYGGPSWQLDTDLFSVNDVRAADPCAALRGQSRYVITSSFEHARFSGSGPGQARQTAFYECLERDGRLVASFGPGRAGSPLPFDLEDLYTPYWRLDQYERPGPTIKIYAVGVAR